MKVLISTFTLALVMLASHCKAQTTTITATIKNIASDEGKVGFALYTEATFMKQPIQAKNAIISNGVSTVVFENIPAGDYAIICYHDKNNNDKMDFQPNGMPLESYGVSNNKLTFGPPTFFDAKFNVSDKELSLEIKF